VILQNKFLSFNKKKAAVLILAAACLIGFFTSLGNGFIIDDYHLVVNNDNIKRLDNLPAVFLSSYLDYYRPLVSFSLASDYFIWRLNPFGYHLTNILFHFLNCLLVFFLAEVLSADYNFSLLNAVLFAIHPLNSVTVNYISDRSNLLACFFMLSALICFSLGYRKHKKYYYPAGYLLFIMALFSRESGLLFPAYLSCVFLFIGKKKDWKSLILLVAGAVIINSAYLLARPDLLSFALAGQGGFELKYLAEFFYMVLKYLSLALFPLNISFFRRIPLLSPAEVIAVFSISALLGFLIYSLRRNKRFLFCVFWFMVGVIPLYKTMFGRISIGLLMQESWIYVSGLGLFGMLAMGLLYLKSKARKNSGNVFIAAVISFFLVMCLMNNTLWKDTPTYCRYWLEIIPDNPIALSNLAGHYLKKRDYVHALSYFKQYIKKVNPGFITPEKKIEILNGIAVCNFKLGRPDIAIGHFEAAIKVDSPAFREDSYFGLGKISLGKGDEKKALSYFKMSLKETMRTIEVIRRDSLIFPYIKRTRAVYALKRTAANIRLLGKFFYERRLWEDARACFELAIKALPNRENYDVYFNLGVVDIKLERTAEAILNFKKAAKSPKYFLKATYSLSILYAETHQKELSQKAMRAVIRKDPLYYTRRAKGS